MFTAIVLGILGGLLNRIRGGMWKIEHYGGSTQAVRLQWAFLFAMVVFWGTIPYLDYRFAVLLLTGYLSWALIGSGANSVMDLSAWRSSWLKGMYPDDTEIYNSWWLPKLFGGTPDLQWSETRFLLYHIVGKSSEGVVRNALAICPIIILDTRVAIIYTLSGVLWGFLFYFAWLAPSSWSLRGWQLGEALVGFLSFFVLGLLLYG